MKKLKNTESAQLWPKYVLFIYKKLPKKYREWVGYSLAFLAEPPTPDAQALPMGPWV